MQRQSSGNVMTLSGFEEGSNPGLDALYSTDEKGKPAPTFFYFTLWVVHQKFNLFCMSLVVEIIGAGHVEMSVNFSFWWEFE